MVTRVLPRGSVGYTLSKATLLRLLESVNKQTNKQKPEPEKNNCPERAAVQTVQSGQVVIDWAFFLFSSSFVFL